ncbi:MAG: BON domain-containing protein, partial [Gemmataceae bacterium]
MTLRRLAWSTLFGLSLLGRPAMAGEPPRLNLPPVNSNQILADQIAGTLRQSAVLRHYQVSVTVVGSDVLLQGFVSAASQRDEVQRLVQGVPGVGRVVDRMHLASEPNQLIRVQGTAPGEPLPPPSVNSREGGRPNLPNPGLQGGASNGPAANGFAPGSIPEPMPIMRGPTPGTGELNPPRMPPYAWPTYAPHNNFSRVGYPEAYPWQAWPFIGPVYPFPKVPLGWRSVKLEWDDGYWWFG